MEATRTEHETVSCSPNCAGLLKAHSTYAQHIANTEVGLRLRYEIVREFAPYIGVTWSRAYGNTADMARDEGEDVGEARFVAGIRLWF